MHAIRNGEKEIGITVHIIDEIFDNGPIVNQGAVKILPGDDMLSLYPRVYNLGADLLLKSIEQISTNDQILKDNDKNIGKYYSYPSYSQIVNYKNRLRELKKGAKK